jgi:hypothetical protein
MTRPLLDLLAGLLLTGGLIGAVSTRAASLRPALVVLATAVTGATMAVVFVGEAARLAIEAGAVGFGEPGQPSPSTLLAAAAAVALAPTAVAAARMLTRARRRATAPAPAGDRS